MNILIFGANGIIGKPLVKLLSENHQVLSPPHHHNTKILGCDLRDWEDTDYYFSQHMRSTIDKQDNIELVINLTGEKTNIARNKTNPVEIYQNTVEAGLNLFRACADYKIPHLIQCVCSCSYAPTKLLKEHEFDKGRPDPSIEPHAYAKRQLYYMAHFYKQQYGLVTTTLCFNNVYGYLKDIESTENLKVLDAMFVKILQGKKLNLWEREFWGTGKPKREFIYYEDVARAINEIVNSGKNFDLLNIGYQKDISIKKLANLIKKKLDYKGDISFVGGQDGQMKKLLDSSLFRYAEFPEFEFTTLEEGIDKMIKEYI